MAKRVKFNDAERMDRADMDALAAEPGDHNQELASKFLFDPSQVLSVSAGAARGFPVSGFKPVVQGAGSAKQLRIDRGVALLGMRDGGVISYGALAVEGNATQIVDLSAYAVDLWSVWVRFDLLTGDHANRILWDPTGVTEYTEAVPTRRTANWSVTLKRYASAGTVLVSPGPEWTRISDVDVQAGTMVVYDRRNLFFEGNIPSLWSKFRPTWGDGTLDRNDDRSLLPSAGGGGIGDLRTFCQATLAKIGELQGAQRVLTTDATGISITTQVGSVQTVTGLAAASPANVGKSITLKGCATPANNGTFKILSFAGSGSYTLSNAAGVAADGNSGSISAVVKDPLWWEATTEAVVDKISRLGDATPDGNYHFKDTGGGHTFLIDSLLTTSKLMVAAGGLSFGGGAADTTGTLTGNGTSPKITLKATDGSGFPGVMFGNVAGSVVGVLDHSIAGNITRLVSSGAIKFYPVAPAGLLAPPPLVITDSTHLDPGADNTVSLGSSGLRWSEVRVASLVATAVGGDLTPNIPGRNLGASAEYWGDLFVNRIRFRGATPKIEGEPILASTLFTDGTAGKLMGVNGSGVNVYASPLGSDDSNVAMTLSNIGSGSNKNPFMKFTANGASGALDLSYNIIDRQCTIDPTKISGFVKVNIGTGSGGPPGDAWIPYFKSQGAGVFGVS